MDLSLIHISGYFLIVQDFIRAAREELDVSVGPGRGSAAGSAVAYCLGITKIDPIAYDLSLIHILAIPGCPIRCRHTFSP